MLKAVILSQRENYVQRIASCERAIQRSNRTKRDSQGRINYRRTIALYRELIAVIDKHDAAKAEVA